MTIDLDAPIEVTMKDFFAVKGYGARLKNALRHDNRRTLRDVLMMSARELGRLPNISHKSINALVQWLGNRNLVLMGSPLAWSNRLDPSDAKAVAEFWAIFWYATALNPRRCRDYRNTMAKLGLVESAGELRLTACGERVLAFTKGTPPLTQVSP